MRPVHLHAYGRPKQQDMKAFSAISTMALQLAAKVLFVIPFTVNVHGEPSEAMDLLFFSASTKQ
jgi:hypothetical protein